MPYFQFIRWRNELTAIPKAGGGLHRHQINTLSDNADNPPQCVVDQFILFHTLYKVIINYFVWTGNLLLKTSANVRICLYTLTMDWLINCVRVLKSHCVCSYSFFWLNPNRVRTFGLTQKNQKVKAASAELLRLSVSLCAPQTRFAQTATLRPLHFVPTLNAHQNEANSMDNFLNWKLKMENWKLISHSAYLMGNNLCPSFFYPWNLPCDGRGAALLRLIT